jgi:glycoprotein endo-alpha-1,2-mannosidase
VRKSTSTTLLAAFLILPIFGSHAFVGVGIHPGPLPQPVGTLTTDPLSVHSGTTGSYPIYQFGLNVTTVSSDFYVGVSGMYLSSMSPSSAASSFQAAWGPSNIGLTRSGTSNVTFSIVGQGYVPSGTPNVELTFSVTGWTGVTMWEENTATASLLASQNVSSAGFLLANSTALEKPNPFLTVRDTLHGASTGQVYAYYYAWYDPPASWLDGVNGSESPSVTGEPALGYYSSHNTSVIDTQIQEAQQAGINAFLESWIPSQSFINQSLQTVFPEAVKLGFKVGLQYETNATLVQTGLTQSQALSTFEGQVEWYLSTYASSPAVLKLNNTPLVFIWQSDSFPASFWQKAFSAIRAVHSAYFIAEASGNFSDFQVFDGVDIYGVNFPMVENGIATNFTGANFTQNTAVNYWDMQWEATLHNKLWFAPAEPGFNDLNDPQEAPKFSPRDNGSVYAATWDLAMHAGADGITVTSWNEWHEGSNIEPAHQGSVSWYTPLQYTAITECEVDRYSNGNTTGADNCTAAVTTTGSPPPNPPPPRPPSPPRFPGWALLPISAGVGVAAAVLAIRFAPHPAVADAKRGMPLSPQSRR